MTGTEAVGVCDGVGGEDGDHDHDADTVAVCDGESPGASDRVTVAVAVPDGVDVGDADGVGVGVQRRSMNCAPTSCVRSRDAIVLFWSSSTLRVWLIARVLHVFAIPAAVQEAGAVPDLE